MRVIIGILELVKTNAIDRTVGLSLVERLSHARSTASANKWRNEEGKTAKLDANLFVEQLKEAEVVMVLRNIDSMSYYPLIYSGKIYKMSQKTEILNAVIANCKKYTGE